MENFITLCVSLFVFLYLYVYSFKLNSYFKNSNGFIFSFLSMLIFTFLLLSVVFVFVDVMTTSTDKNFLNFKETFALDFLFCFEVLVMIVIPSIYMYYLINSTNEEDKIYKFRTSDRTKYIFLYSIYILFLSALNVLNVKLFPYFYNQNFNNTGFSEKVPEGLAIYSKIDTVYQRIVYFNFGLLMMVGKFLGFTYMPYGMTKYVYDLIYSQEKNTSLENNFNLEGSIHNIYTETNKFVNNKSEHQDYNGKDNFIILANSTPSGSKDSSSGFFSKENSDKSKSKKTKSNDIEEKNSPSFDSNSSLHMNNSEEDESFLTNEAKEKKKKIITVDQYLENLTQLENDKKISELIEKANENYNNPGKKRKVNINIVKPLSTSIFNIFYYSYIIFSIMLVFVIIYTKITILYIKLMYNICGVDCGLLAYRFDDVLSLETAAISLSAMSQNFNTLLKFDFLFFAFILLFRTLTIYKSFSLKGISFMWKIFYKPDPNMSSYHVIQIYWTILFTGMVLLYDFTYLFPDYIRFNGLDPVCDYTLINKSYCGVSFYGLLFIKISMNYHLFMYWDIIASAVFITNSIIWTFRLIINPLTSSLCDKICSKTKNWKSENENLKFI